jgi:phage terminase large subunit-like protein
LFDWGDGTSSGWLGPYDSGQYIEKKHIWEGKGSWIIRLKAKDMSGTQSEWSEPFTLTISQEKKLSKTRIIHCIHTLMERFPISKIFFSHPAFSKILDIEMEEFVLYHP